MLKRKHFREMYDFDILYLNLWITFQIVFMNITSPLLSSDKDWSVYLPTQLLFLFIGEHPPPQPPPAASSWSWGVKGWVKERLYKDQVLQEKYLLVRDFICF